MTDETPRAVIELFGTTLNDHDVPGCLALFPSDARLVAASGRAMDLVDYEQLLLHTLKGFPDFSVEVERWTCEGEVVVTEAVLVGTHRGPFAGLEPTGLTIEMPMCHVSRVRAGRIVERIAYHDTAGILRRLSGADG